MFILGVHHVDFHVLWSFNGNTVVTSLITEMVSYIRSTKEIITLFENCRWYIFQLIKIRFTTGQKPYYRPYH